jgi:hypothetical protein
MTVNKLRNFGSCEAQMNETKKTKPGGMETDNAILDIKSLVSQDWMQ